MASNLQMLKQVRAVTSLIAQTTDNAGHKSLLSVADIYLNNLLLQQAPQFYLELVEQGRALVEEGAGLAAKLNKKLLLPPAPAIEVHPDSRMETIDTHIHALFDRLVAIIGVLDESRSAQEKDFLVRVSHWESRFYKHSTEDASTSAPVKAREIMPEAVQTYLEKKFPQWKDVKVNKFVVLEGGISKKTILFETHDAVNGAQSLVIRAEQPCNLLNYDGSRVALEFYSIKAMHQAGMPVAEPLWVEEDARHLGNCFLVSRKAEGKPIGGNFGPYEPLTPGQLESYMSNFFKLHSIRLDPADPAVQKSHLKVWSRFRTTTEADHFFVTETLPQLISHGQVRTTPQIARAMKWLEKNVPVNDEPPVIIHIDYAFNNMIFDGDRMTALLDWETTRLGDPANDFIWTQINLGLYSMEEFRQKYHEGTGRYVSDYRIAYAQITKCMINLIAGWTGAQFIDSDDSAPLHMGVMAYKFMPMLCPDIDGLIAAAEAAKGK